MLGGAASRNSPETFDRWFEAMLSTASLSSVLCWACSRTSDPTSVSRRLRVERSSRRTPSWSSRSATRRLTVEVGILRRRAASEKPFASTTLAKIISEFKSIIVILQLLQVIVRRFQGALVAKLPFLNIIPNSGNTFALSPASRAGGAGLYFFLRASSNRKDRNHECKRRSGCRCTSEISRRVESIRHRCGDEALCFRWRVYAAAQPFQYRCRCGPQSV